MLWWIEEHRYSISQYMQCIYITNNVFWMVKKVLKIILSPKIGVASILGVYNKCYFWIIQ